MDKRLTYCVVILAFLACGETDEGASEGTQTDAAVVDPCAEQEDGTCSAPTEGHECCSVNYREVDVAAECILPTRVHKCAETAGPMGCGALYVNSCYKRALEDSGYEYIVAGEQSDPQLFGEGFEVCAFGETWALELPECPAK